MGDRLAAAQHVDRRLRQRARAVGRRHHDRAAAVGHQANIAHGERIADRPRVQHVGDGQRLLLPRGRVQQRPFARRHRDLGHLFPRRAEFEHVPVRRHGVGGGGQERPERRLVRIVFARAGAAPADRALRAAISDHRDLNTVRPPTRPARARRGFRTTSRRRSWSRCTRPAGRDIPPATWPRCAPATSRKTRRRRPPDVRPASSSARWIPCAIRSIGDISAATAPMSDSAAPMMAAEPRVRPFITRPPPE